MRRKALLTIALLAAPLTLVGCGGGEDPDPSPSNLEADDVSSAEDLSRGAGDAAVAAGPEAQVAEFRIAMSERRDAAEARA